MAPHRRTFSNIAPVWTTPYQKFGDAVPSFDMTEELAERLTEALGAQLSLDDPDLDYITDTLESMRMVWVDTTDPHAIRLAIAAGRHKAGIVMSQFERGEDGRLRPDTNRWDEARPNSTNMRYHGNPTVYYFRLGNRCKIGFTVDLRRRRASIQPEEVLATEPGSFALERERHEQFAALRVAGEWFKYEGALVAHVEALQAATAA